MKYMRQTILSARRSHNEVKKIYIRWPLRQVFNKTVSPIIRLAENGVFTPLRMIVLFEVE